MPQALSGQPGNMDFSGFNRSDWTLSNDAAHRESVEEVQKCQTKTTRTKKESDVGCRYSVLLDLPYFDVVKMHNIGKHMIQIWIKHKFLSAFQLPVYSNYCESDYTSR